MRVKDQHAAAISIRDFQHRRTCRIETIGAGLFKPGKNFHIVRQQAHEPKIQEARLTNLTRVPERGHAVAGNAGIILIQNHYIMKSNKSGEYKMLTTRELMALVVEEYQPGQKQAFGLAIVQLEAACKVEPENDELKKVRKLVHQIEKRFDEHCGKEKRLLFPLFAAGEQKNDELSAKELSVFIQELSDEHEEQRQLYRNLRLLTHDFRFDPPASPAHKLAYAHLDDLEQDFLRMAFIEEEYLFPRLEQIKSAKKN